MARFASWRRDDGASVDPWVRTHERLGATILGPAAADVGTYVEENLWMRHHS